MSSFYDKSSVMETPRTLYDETLSRGISSGFQTCRLPCRLWNLLICFAENGRILVFVELKIRFALLDQDLTATKSSFTRFTQVSRFFMVCNNIDWYLLHIVNKSLIYVNSYQKHKYWIRQVREYCLEELRGWPEDSRTVCHPLIRTNISQLGNLW